MAKIIASILSGAYWLSFFFFAESITAADYRPGSDPSETFIDLKIAAVLITGPLLFALLIMLWRRIEGRVLANRIG